jgi:uncharacterized protein (TIGR00297 family)
MRACLLFTQFSLAQLAAGLILSTAIALISYRYKAVSGSGAAGMISVGTVIFGLGGLAFTIPLLFFFISSSVFSIIHTPGKIKSLADAEKSSRRDIGQVMANGGIGAFLTLAYFFTGNIIWYFPYLASLCEAAADTWATELGTLYPDSPISIVSLKRVDPGQSGGISIIGTLSAISGTMMTMLVASAAGFLIPELMMFEMTTWLITASCGLAGAILDSVLGASLQAQYRCQACHHWTERHRHCDQSAVLVRGVRFINNDFVNITCTLFAALLASILLILVF